MHLASGRLSAASIKLACTRVPGLQVSCRQIAVWGRGGGQSAERLKGRRHKDEPGAAADRETTINAMKAIGPIPPLPFLLALRAALAQAGLIPRRLWQPGMQALAQTHFGVCGRNTAAADTVTVPPGYRRWKRRCGRGGIPPPAARSSCPLASASALST